MDSRKGNQVPHSAAVVVVVVVFVALIVAGALECCALSGFEPLLYPFAPVLELAVPGVLFPHAWLGSVLPTHVDVVQADSLSPAQGRHGHMAGSNIRCARPWGLLFYDMNATEGSASLRCKKTNNNNKNRCSNTKIQVQVAKTARLT